jgi:pimeloyl-ACP methyl ester carboxylesterase
MTKMMKCMAVFFMSSTVLISVPLLAQAAATSPTRFTVVDEGTEGKPDVVLVPGLTSSREVWAGEAKRLAPHYRLHLVQLNGFAGQPAGPNATGKILPAIVDELHAYCNSLRTKPQLIGHSLGGLITLMLVEKYPNDAKKIVIADSLPFFGMLFGQQMTVETIQTKAEQMREKIEKQDATERKAGAERSAATLVLNPQGRILVEKNSEDSDPHVVAEAMFEDLQTDLRPELANIKTPTLMLYPFDSALKADGTQQVDELYQRAYKPMPDVTLLRVEGSRHFIMLDQAEKFDELVQGFLSR